MSVASLNSTATRLLKSSLVPERDRQRAHHVRLNLKIVASIIIVESLIMLALPILHRPGAGGLGRNAWSLPVLDTALLIAIATPIIYFWAVRPFLARQEKALHKVSDIFETLDMMPLSVTLVDPQTLRFRYMNRTALARLKWSEGDYRTRKVTDALADIDEAAYRKFIAPLFSGETDQVVGERTDLRGNPIRVWYHVVTPRTGETTVVAIAQNIADQKAAEEDARILSQSLDLIQDEVYLFWPDSYEFIYLNQTAAARAAGDGRPWRGHKISEFISQSQFETLKERCQALMRGPERCFSYEMVDKNHRALEIYLHLVEPSGAQPRFLAIYRDITERKVADRAKAQFVSTVSHELRTPLTSIKGALGLIEAGAGGNLPGRAAQLVKMAHKNSDRLIFLINDLLDMDKLESGQISIKRSPVDLAAVVREAIEANQGYAARHDVTIKATRLEDGLIALGDRHRLRQVLDNLISNAAKFSFSGQEIELCAAGDHDRIVISVRDHGTGIPPEAHDTIFDRFTQVDSSDQRQKGGTGLGLSISKSIVELHDGKIHFVSEPGKGTTFFVELPRHATQSHAGGAQSDNDPA